MPDPSFPSQPLYIKHYFPNIMDKIPNMDNALKIVSLLEKDIFQEYSVHQISKLVSLDYKTISKTIKQLLSMKIITTKTKGKGHFISLNLNHYDLQIYLSFATYYNRLLFFQKDTSLQYLVEELKVMDLRNSCLILFGSHVVQQQTKSSDVDLLLITNNQQTATRIKSLLLNYNLKADLNILSFSHYEKALRSREFNLVNQVLPKHIILKNPALYWDLTLGRLKDGNRY